MITRLVLVLFCFSIFASGRALGQESSAQSKAIGVRRAIDAVDANWKPPQRWALIIGVGGYSDESIPDLPACTRDGKAVSEVLTDPMRGMIPADNVRLLLDEEVTRDKVIEALVWLKRQAAPDDMVMVYFSGHGAVDEEGKAYWLMQNSRLSNLRGTAFEELNITNLLGEIRSKRLVVLVDACFAAATAHLNTKSAVVNVGSLYEKFNGTGRVLISSSNGEEPSLVIEDPKHPGNGHSVFTWHLLEAVQGRSDANRDGVITLDEVWKYLSPSVDKTANKLGGKMTPRIKGEMGGELLFAVDSDQLIKLQQANELELELKAKRLRTLKELALDDSITMEQYRDGKRLLELPEPERTPLQCAIVEEYIGVIEGRIPASKLNRSIELARLDYSIAEQSSSDAKISHGELFELYKELGLAPELYPGCKAPEFGDYKFVQGKKFREFKPKTIHVVNSFASWCAPCRIATQTLESFKEKFPQIVFVEVCLEPAEDVVKFLEEPPKDVPKKVTYSFAVEEEDAEGNIGFDGKFIKTWVEPSGGGGIPTCFVIDQKGNIAWIGHPGDLEKSEVLSRLQDGTWNIEQHRDSFALASDSTADLFSMLVKGELKDAATFKLIEIAKTNSDLSIIMLNVCFQQSIELMKLPQNVRERLAEFCFAECDRLLEKEEIYPESILVLQASAHGLVGNRRLAISILSTVITKHESAPEDESEEDKALRLAFVDNVKKLRDVYLELE